MELMDISSLGDTAVTEVPSSKQGYTKLGWRLPMRAYPDPTYLPYGGESKVNAASL